MFEKFFMNVNEYWAAVCFYAKKFQLERRWTVSMVDSFPDNLKTNYPEIDKIVACTDWGSATVLFKSKLLKMPKFLASAYIRHEIRHCAQMEAIDGKMREKYGDNLSSIYTQMVIVSDNQNGYGKSMMEADAWLAFFGIYLNIDKVANKIIKKNFLWL